MWDEPAQSPVGCSGGLEEDGDVAVDRVPRILVGGGWVVDGLEEGVSGAGGRFERGMGEEGGEGVAEPGRDGWVFPEAVGALDVEMGEEMDD